MVSGRQLEAYLGTYIQDRPSPLQALEHSTRGCLCTPRLFHACPHAHAHGLTRTLKSRQCGRHSMCGMIATARFTVPFAGVKVSLSSVASFYPPVQLAATERATRGRASGSTTHPILISQSPSHAQRVCPDPKHKRSTAKRSCRHYLSTTTQRRGLVLLALPRLRSPSPLDSGLAWCNSPASLTSSSSEDPCDMDLSSGPDS